jgi:hypothetical protein
MNSVEGLHKQELQKQNDSDWEWTIKALNDMINWFKEEQLSIEDAFRVKYIFYKFFSFLIKIFFFRIEIKKKYSL